MASGWRAVGSLPALCTSKSFLPRNWSRPSAIWERAELWVHRKRTRIGYCTQSSVAISSSRGKSNAMLVRAPMVDQNDKVQAHTQLVANLAKRAQPGLRVTCNCLGIREGPVNTLWI